MKVAQQPGKLIPLREERQRVCAQGAPAPACTWTDRGKQESRAVLGGGKVRGAFVPSRCPSGLCHCFLCPPVSKLCRRRRWPFPFWEGWGAASCLHHCFESWQFHSVTKLCGCFSKLQLSKQAGWCVCVRVRRQATPSKHFIRANALNYVQGPRNFTGGLEMPDPTEGPLRSRE